LVTLYDPGAMGSGIETAEALAQHRPRTTGRRTRTNARKRIGGIKSLQRDRVFMRMARVRV
jgi:hypothetical protein